MAVRIGVGLAGFPFEGPADFWRWIELCEASDVDSFWQSDRLISRAPGLDSIATMGALAGGTSRLKFGMSVTVVSFRDPLVLAKECATIDYLSNGRLLPAFGVGTGGAPEWRALGISEKRRGARADEALTLLARLWSEESVDFEGEFYRYEGVTIAPRPVQQPLPLWIGGSSPAAIRRTARLGTGWLAGIQTPAEAAPVVAAIRDASAEAGRPVDAEHYGAGFPFRFGSQDDAAVQQTARGFQRFRPDFDLDAYLAVGDAATVLARIEEYRRAGMTKFVLRPVAEDAKDLLAQTERLVAEVLAAIHG
ncbi:MAG: LLM class flavin-dependent oxidoreductase [Myxococcota bacterium]